jgi:hypothetical protein
MQRLRSALTCALLAALTGVAVQAMLLLHAATGAARALPVAIVGEVRAARVDLTAQVAAARQDVLARSERQVAALRTDVIGQVATIGRTADRRIGDTLDRADAALGKVEELRGDLKPTLDHAGSVAAQVDDAAPLFLDCEFNPDCLFNRYVGAAKGIENAAQNVGRTSADISGAVPGILATWGQIGANVARATDESAQTAAASREFMNNMAAMTKPLPSWLRIGLAVAPPIVQTGFTTASWLAVKGKQQ